MEQCLPASALEVEVHVGGTQAMVWAGALVTNQTLLDLSDATRLGEVEREGGQVRAGVTPAGMRTLKRVADLRRLRVPDMLLSAPILRTPLLETLRTFE